MVGRVEQEIIIAFPGQNERVFARDHDNIPVPLRPQPVLFPAFYLSSNEDLETHLPAARLSLSTSPQRTLLKLVSSPDGPPNRMARIFTHIRQEQLGVLQGRRLTPKLPVQIYREVQKENYVWDNDSTKSGQGLFIEIKSNLVYASLEASRFRRRGSVVQADCLAPVFHP